MVPTRFELEPGIVLDARRAVWFAEARALAVADLHLGYAWGHRATGSMFPIEAPDDTLDRLLALVREYDARQLLVLGDIVQRAVPLKPVREELERLHAELGPVALRLLAGNHDRGLAPLLAQWGLAVTLDPLARLGSHTLLHGDAALPEETAGRVFIGHEHPAIRLGDGIAGLRCPCFLIGPRVIVLPAFSAWAAGTEVRGATFLSPLAQAERFHRAIAIMAGKLLPVPLGARNIPRS